MKTHLTKVKVAVGLQRRERIGQLLQEDFSDKMEFELALEKMSTDGQGGLRRKGNFWGGKGVRVHWSRQRNVPLGQTLVARWGWKE